MEEGIKEGEQVVVVGYTFSKKARLNRCSSGSGISTGKK
jgi:hypothetical protein